MVQRPKGLNLDIHGFQQLNLVGLAVSHGIFAVKAPVPGRFPGNKGEEPDHVLHGDV